MWGENNERMDWDVMELDKSCTATCYRTKPICVKYQVFRETPVSAYIALYVLKMSVSVLISVLTCYCEVNFVGCPFSMVSYNSERIVSVVSFVQVADWNTARLRQRWRLKLWRFPVLRWCPFICHSACKVWTDRAWDIICTVNDCSIKVFNFIIIMSILHPKPGWNSFRKIVITRIDFAVDFSTWALFSCRVTAF